MKNVFFYDFPIGTIGIAEDGGEICRIFFGKDCPKNFEVLETSLICKAANQLFEYFDGKRKIFDLPLKLCGTDFQVCVWKALQTVPFGETRSYKDLAEKIGVPKACRAVGSANNKNPLLIVVPCHRIVGHDGSLKGFAAGIPVKQFLLDFERRQK